MSIVICYCLLLQHCMMSCLRICYNKGMALTHYIIDANTPPALIPLIMAYRPHTQPPSRQQMLESRYELDGHLTMVALAQDVGITIEGRNN